MRWKNNCITVVFDQNLDSGTYGTINIEVPEAHKEE
jgi:hypothetical protein